MRVAMAIAGCATALALGGCREEPVEVPSACRQGPEPIARALAAAPGEVRLEGGVRLSECVNADAEPGALGDVAQGFIGVAAELAPAAEEDPASDGAVRLGYLLGALERSERGAQNVGYELGRRVRQELSGIDRRGAAFRRGLRAGRNGG